MMKYIFYIGSIMMCLSTMTQAQVGITSLNMTSSFNTSNSNTFNLNVRDNIMIGDGENSIVGDFDYNEDTLVVVGGDIIDFSLAFNDPNPATVRIWHDVNNDNDFEASELIHESTSTSPISNTFIFPIDPLPIVPKGFSVQLIQNSNTLTDVTFESSDNPPTEIPKLVITASVNRRNNINGVVCVPSDLPFKFGVASDYDGTLTIGEVELKDRVDIDNNSLNSDFPTTIFKKNGVATNSLNKSETTEGNIINNPLRRGEQGMLVCQISDSSDTIFIDAKYKADCCPNDILEFVNEDDMYYFNSAFDFISIADNVEIGTDNCAFYKAENYVRMLPGFSAQAGSFVKAYIDPCVAFSGFMNENDANTQFLSNDNSQNGNFNQMEDKLTIFPNPVSGTFTLDYFIAQDKSDVTLTIYDILGKKLDNISHHKKQMSGTHQLQYNADRLVSGVYIVRLQIEDNIISKKIQKL